MCFGCVLGKPTDGKSADEKKEARKKQIHQEKIRTERHDQGVALRSALGRSGRKPQAPTMPAAMPNMFPNEQAAVFGQELRGKGKGRGRGRGVADMSRKRPRVDANQFGMSTRNVVTDRDFQLVLEHRYAINKGPQTFRLASGVIHNTY